MGIKQKMSDIKNQIALILCGLFVLFALVLITIITHKEIYKEYRNKEVKKKRAKIRLVK